MRLEVRLFRLLRFFRQLATLALMVPQPHRRRDRTISFPRIRWTITKVEAMYRTYQDPPRGALSGSL